MRYKLRTLLILLAVGPPMLAGAWLVVKSRLDDYRRRQTATVGDLGIKGKGAPMVVEDSAKAEQPAVP
jgi:hypothetical protein